MLETPLSSPLNRRGFLARATSAALIGLTQKSCRTADPVIAAPTTGTRRFGEPDPSQVLGMMPIARRPEAMLEVFLLGGLSPWETFYLVPEFGDPSRGGPYAGQQWWAFQGDGEHAVPAWWKSCMPGSGPMYVPYANDAAGVQVNLGPFLQPLRDRPDLLKRMRVWVMRHDLEPHEFATPLAMTGQPQGSPRMAALGTHLSRYFEDRAPPGRTAPHSYSISMSSFDVDNNGDAASAIGLHRGVSRPLAIRLGPESRLSTQLLRGNLEGFRQPLDTLVKHWTDRARARLRSPGRLDDTRAPGLTDFAAARAAMVQHQDLQRLLPQSLLEAKMMTLCPGSVAEPVLDEVTTGMQLARSLLTDATSPARYVQLLEGGLYTDPSGAGYDTHGTHIVKHAPNTVHMCRQLAAIINEPGEKDPRKLDLDRHFVLLNTEFGRTPYPEFTRANPNGNGTNHWPWGYVVVGFGGFIDEERSGIIGAIGEDGYALSGFSPSAHRAAMMLAMGAWPFSDLAFAVGDVEGAASELEAALRIREEILGYTS